MVSSLGRRRTAVAVAVATLLALALRFVALGDRVFHWDEARVGYWILQYQATGEYQYRAIVHGPFLFHVNEFVFGYIGTTDAAARYVVALVGGLLPASAWLFRTRLRDVEVAALAGLLALNPVLVYYSRFMRNDVLVGAFSLVALGLAVRAIDTDRRGYLVAAGAALGLAFATKENALVYVGMFVGATALLFDARLFTARTRSETWESVTHDYLRRSGNALLAWRGAVAGAAVAFLAVVVFFFAPRPEFYRLFGDPALLPDVLGAATLGAWQEFWGTWGTGGVSRAHSYIEYLRDAITVLEEASLLLTAAAVLGFLAERYVPDEPRDFVLFAGYWAAASLVIYPIITDISGHWSVTHAVVPMTIPAAVGIRLVVDRGRDAFASEDRVGVALAAVVLLATVAQMGAVTAETSYLMPQDEDNVLVQWGQPGSEMGDTLADVESVAQAHDGGTDVFYYGRHFYSQDEDGPDGPATGVSGQWRQRFPLTWYVQRAGAETDSSVTPSDLEEVDAPVVVTRASNYRVVEPALDGYDSWTYELTNSNVVFVVFIDRDAPGYQPS